MTRVLIVEDEAAIAELQRDYLALNGFQVDICLTGTEGLQRARDGGYDLIILDLNLPGVDGFELCKQIRQMSDVPILIVSAKQEEADKIRGFGLGADDFVTKPFSPSELVARAKAHLSRYERLIGSGKKASTDEIRIRELTIDMASHRVFVRGKEVAFTAREFDLLVFLALHPNRLFSKEELFKRIWGLESVGDTATVTVHVRRLREKIETDPSNPQFIETVWGAGYRFTV